MHDLELVEKIRAFNRLYMPVMSLLNSNYLNSDFSVTEARILYELYENAGCNANFIARKLHIDKSYLSRVLARFEKKKLLRRVVSEKDMRAYRIMLTDKGIAETEELIRMVNTEILRMIEKLSVEECKKLEYAFDTITCLFFDKMEE